MHKPGDFYITLTGNSWMLVQHVHNERTAVGIWFRNGRIRINAKIPNGLGMTSNWTKING